MTLFLNKCLGHANFMDLADDNDDDGAHPTPRRQQRPRRPRQLRQQIVSLDFFFGRSAETIFINLKLVANDAAADD